VSGNTIFYFKTPLRFYPKRHSFAHVFYNLHKVPNLSLDANVLFRCYSLAAIANHALEDLQLPLVDIHPAMTHRDPHRQAAQEPNLFIYVVPLPMLLL